MCGGPTSSGPSAGSLQREESTSRPSWRPTRGAGGPQPPFARASAKLVEQGPGSRSGVDVALALVEGDRSFERRHAASWRPPERRSTSARTTSGVGVEANPQGIVLVGDGDAEHAHDAVVVEALGLTAMLGEHRRDDLEEAMSLLPSKLWIKPTGRGGLGRSPATSTVTVLRAAAAMPADAGRRRGRRLRRHGHGGRSAKLELGVPAQDGLVELA